MLFVLYGFLILLMILLLGYMGYRLFVRRKPLLLAVIALHIAAITLAVLTFTGNVQLTLWAEIYILLAGILGPSAFFVLDYLRLINKAKEQGLYEGIVPIRNNEAEYKTYYNRGVSQYRSGLFKNAVESFWKAVRMNPKSHEAWYNLAIAIIDGTDRPADAVEPLKKVIVLKPEFIDAYNNLGILLSTLGRHQEALDSYKNGLNRNSGDFSLYYNMGITLAETDRLPEAVQAYKKAMELKPEEFEIRYHLGAVLTEMRKYTEAVEVYKSALKVKPEDSEMFYNISIVYALLRRYDIAMDNLKKAIELNGQFREDARSNLAFLSLRGHKEFKELVS